ncbi:DNA alkylation repair protein [Candidatus Pacearchaeota archaeon]|nr:hypothetical protein [uncultured archaeon]AQS33217.1 hypothetical protein [uncultured archaeon]MBS3091563.1 DNA alkylation repair protein [Candidatus Pacearchaeota archaeon]
MSLKLIRKEIRKAANPKKAKLLLRFFKTGKGEYGEGDVFLGITVPKQREIVKKFKDLPLRDIEDLVKSKIHEERLIALLLLVYNYQKHQEMREEIYAFYLKNIKHVNNWDLVDLSAPNIVGKFLLKIDKSSLYYFLKSKNIWKRRIAVLSTFEFIRNNDFEDALKIAELLLKDKHDLIYKAVGWMLREIGKRNTNELIKFLNTYYKKMPRTMLRYSIEKLPEKQRKTYLNSNS